MEKQYKLHHPLLHKTTINSTTTTTTDHATNIPPNSPGMIPRLILLFLIGAISLWANYESSKGFNLTILNEAGSNTVAGKRFHLFYISNDEISRLVLRTSQVIENILYPSDNNIYIIKKQVNHVIIKLSSRNLTSSTEGEGATKRAIVKSSNDHKYVIEISNLVMEGKDFRQAMFLAIQQGMAKVWLFNGNGKAPLNLVNGIVKYISEFSGSNNQVLRSHKLTRLSEGFCWEGMDEDHIAKFLNYCEMNMEGFVRNLNQEMKDGWNNDQMLQKNCKRSSSSPLHLINTTSSNSMESNV